jgi:hypothetical protein
MAFFTMRIWVMVKTMVKAVVKPVKMFPESESIEINDVLIVFGGYYNPPRPNGTRSVCFPVQIASKLHALIQLSSDL